MPEGNFCIPGDLLCVLCLPSNLAKTLTSLQRILFCASANADCALDAATANHRAVLPMLDPVLPLGVLHTSPKRGLLLQEAKSHPVFITLIPEARFHNDLGIYGLRCLLHAPKGLPGARYGRYFWETSAASGELNSLIYLAERTACFAKEKSLDLQASVRVPTEAVISDYIAPIHARTRALTLKLLRIDEEWKPEASVGVFAGRRFTTLFTQKLTRLDAKPEKQ